MTNHARIDAWFSQAHGKAVNPDKSYGLQCKDTIDDYGPFLYGVPWTVCVGGANAKDVPNVAPSKYWKWTPNDSNKPEQVPSRGDVIIWGGNRNNEFGHIAVVLTATTQSVKVLQQDGGAEPKVYQRNADGSEGYYSMQPIHEYELGYDNPYTGPVLGWLTPREELILPWTTPIVNEDNPMAKTYVHETKWTTKNQVARSFYGNYPAKPTGITIHHWGEMGQSFDNVANFLSTNSVPTSAHYVVQDGRIATLAAPEVATFHSGNSQGNVSTIGIEMRPECTPGDMDTLVQLVYELEQTYGSMNIYKHSDWFATACPGRYGARIPEIIERVNAMHKNGGVDPKLSTGTPTPVKPEPAPVKPEPVKPAPVVTPSSNKETTVALSDNEIEQIAKRVLDLPITTEGQGKAYSQSTSLRVRAAWGKHELLVQEQAITKKIDELKALIEELKAAKGE